MTGRRPAVKAPMVPWKRRRPAARLSPLARLESVTRRNPVAVIVAALLIVVLLGVLGFAVHVLWWLALVALIFWVLGFVLRVGETIAKPPRRRWYYW